MNGPGEEPAQTTLLADDDESRRKVLERRLAWIFCGVAILSVALGVGWDVAACAAEAVVGEPAPDFTLTDTTGQVRSLSELKGTSVVLEWFNNDCPFVRKHYESGNMQWLQAAYTGRGVAWLTIISSAPGKQGHVSPEQANVIITERGSSQTAMLLDPDGHVGRLYGAKTTPHMFIIDPDGTLIYAGAIDDKASTNPADLARATNYVQRALEEALAGAPVSIPETRSYGCSVKY
jgi:peroxiredoxin